MITFKRGDEVRFIVESDVIDFKEERKISTRYIYFAGLGESKETPIFAFPYLCNSYDDTGVDNSCSYELRRYNEYGTYGILSMYMIEIESKVKFCVLVSFDNDFLTFKEFDNIVFADDFIKEQKELQ